MATQSQQPDVKGGIIFNVPSIDIKNLVDGATIVYNPSTGQIGLNVANANTWSATETFNDTIIVSAATNNNIIEITNTNNAAYSIVFYPGAIDNSAPYGDISYSGNFSGFPNILFMNGNVNAPVTDVVDVIQLQPNATLTYQYSLQLLNGALTAQYQSPTATSTTNYASPTIQLYNSVWDSTTSAAVSNSFNFQLTTANLLQISFNSTNIFSVSNSGNVSATGYKSTAGASTSVTAGTSPYTYTNSSASNQQVFVQGGTVTALSFLPNGSTTGEITISQLTGNVLILRPGDAISITYTTAPTITTIQV